MNNLCMVPWQIYATWRSKEVWTGGREEGGGGGGMVGGGL